MSEEFKRGRGEIILASQTKVDYPPIHVVARRK